VIQFSRSQAGVKPIGVKIDELENSKIIPDGSGSSEFEIKTRGIANQLRQTWERAIKEKVFRKTITRFLPNVMTKNLNEVYFDCTTDYQTIHEGMSAISNYAHDNPEYGGSASPTVQQLKENKELLETWIKKFDDRQRKYRQERQNTPAI